jgi:preprotein translocase subunit SecE
LLRKRNDCRMTAPQPVEPKAAAPLDSLLLLLSVAALVGGIAAFYALAGQLNVTVRVLLVLAGLGVAAVLAYQTASGKTMWGYIRGSQVELRKTTWPTRQESLQATLMIAVVVLIAALLLWGLDSALLWGVKSVTGRG